MIRLLTIALVTSCLATGVVTSAMADASCRGTGDRQEAGRRGHSPASPRNAPGDAAGGSTVMRQAATKRAEGAARTSFVKKCARMPLAADPMCRSCESAYSGDS